MGNAFILQFFMNIEDQKSRKFRKKNFHKRNLTRRA